MKTILIVDDHPINREFLTTLLNYRGYRTLVAGDGLEALSVVRKYLPDLVIADILMPTMDGYEFVQKLRSEPQIATTRIIFYTATYREHDARQLASRCGVADVLIKPCEPDIILATVERALNEVLQWSPTSDLNELDQQHRRLMTNKLKFLADNLGLTNERYAALIEINLQLASEREPSGLLTSLCHIARKLVSARSALVAVREGDGSDQLFLISSGLPDTIADSLQLSSLNYGALSDVVKNCEPYRVLNPGSNADIGLPETYPPIRALLAVPIASLSQTYGVICLCDPLSAEQFDEEQQHLLTILAAQAGRIYENGSLYASLQEHEQRFRQLAENLRDVFWLVSLETGQGIYTSPAFETIWGRSRQKNCGGPASWFDSIHPDDRHKIPDLTPSTAFYDMEYRILRPDGSIRWIHDRGFPVSDTEGHIYRFAGIAEDITKRKNDEEKIARLSRIYAVLSRINAAIVRIHDRQELFEEACHIVIKHGQFGMAWIGMLQPQSQEIRLIAQAGIEEDIAYLKHKPRTARADIPAGQGTVGQALRSLKPAVCNDIANSPNVGTSRKEALARGYHSVIALPLITDNKAVGVVVLFAKEANFFDENELSLLTQLASDISFALEFIETAEQAQYLAYYDALSGLSNRTMFHERLGQYIQSSEREHERLALLILDINRFKTINDTYGREAADNVIQTLAQRLQQCVADAGQLARVGADQFGIVLPDIRQAGQIARLVESKIQPVLQQSITLGEEEIKISAKIGIAVFPEDAPNAEALFLNAELAVKKAKNQAALYLFFDRKMSEQVAEKLAMENKLRQALVNDEFVLYYQPKVCLKTGVISGMEALIRWQSPELGLVAPIHFIPLLEETGLILDVGSWVMQQALTDARQWQEAGIIVPRIAVNVSMLQLRQADFVSRVKQVALSLSASDTQPLPADIGLDLELTESMVMGNIEDSLCKLNAVRRLGFGVAIDDFGTGYSSLSYIARLPIDTIKIDRSFIIKMAQHADDMMIVSTITTMAHNMKIKVVAEGVDSDEQVQILRDMNCDEMQGYLFSKPVTAQQMAQLLSLGKKFTLAD